MVGLGAGLVVGASPQRADAAVEGSTTPQTIAAAGTSASGQSHTIAIDLDGDGNTEFDLVGYLASNTSVVYVRVEPVEAGAQVVGSSVFPVLAEKLSGSTSIDAGSTFVTANPSLAWSETKGDSGDWQPATQRGYVGVSFDFGGNTHYGSLDVEVSKFVAIYNSPLSEFETTLHGYVWETTPGVGILAGAEVPPAVPVDTLTVGLILGVTVCLMGIRRLRRVRA